MQVYRCKINCDVGSSPLHGCAFADKNTEYVADCRNDECNREVKEIINSFGQKEEFTFSDIYKEDAKDV